MPQHLMAPEGLRVAPDGSWQVGEHAVVHPAGLAYLKARLVFENGGAFVMEGSQRAPVQLDGPPFQVLRLLLDARQGEATVALDDGSVEPVRPHALGMDPASGRFECLVRDGQARAVFSRAAHQTLLEHVDEAGGDFFLVVGATRIPVRV